MLHSSVVTTHNIRTFCTPHPRRNLPAISSNRRGESDFSRAFQRSFLASEARSGIGGHEFELPGYGIADFVWAQGTPVSQGQAPRPARTASPRLTSFEMKLSGWRKALRQAYRYTYFSDRVIIVLPMDIARAAHEALPVLKELGIGLWGFDKKSGRISKRTTPRFRQPKSPAAKERAVQLLFRKFNLSRSGEES